MSENKLRFTKKAISDLSEIWNYTFANWSEEQADIYYSALITCCRNLTQNSSIMGWSYDRILPGLRSIKCGHHIIFYNEDENGIISVVRILHEKMDLRRHR